MNFGNFTPRTDLLDADVIVGERGTQHVGLLRPESRWTWLTFRTAAGIFFPQTYINMASLRAATAAGFISGREITLLGYTTAGDGGGGGFYYDTASSAQDDLGLRVVKPTSVSGAGRWLRKLDGFGFNPKWAGAKGDGLTNPLSSADAAAFNTAFNIAAAAGDERDWACIQAILSSSAIAWVNCPAGKFLLNRSIEVGSEAGYASLNVVIRGQSTGGSYNQLQTAFIFTGSSDAIIHSRGDNQGMRIRGITFAITTSSFEQTRATVLSRDVTAVLVTGTAGVNTCQRTRVKDCNFFSVTRCLSMTTASFQFDMFEVDHCSAYSVNDGFHCNASNAAAHAKFSQFRIAYFRYAFDLAVCGPLTVDTCDGSLIEAPVAKGAFFHLGTVKNIKVVNASHEDFGSFGANSLFILTDSGGGIKNVVLDSCVSAGNFEFNGETYITAIGGEIGGTSFIIENACAIVLINNDPAGRPTFTGSQAAAATITNLDGFSANRTLNIDKVNFDNLCSITQSALTPEGAITALEGSLHIRTGTPGKGRQTYYKASGVGNTGWALLSPPVICTAVLTSAETIATATATAVPWDNSSPTDVATMWNIAAPTRLVPPTGAKRVRLTGGAQWSGTGGVKEMWIRTKGGTLYSDNTIFGMTTVPAGSEAFTVLTPVFEVGDTAGFELVVKQASGGDLSLLARGSTNNGTFLCLEVLEWTA